MLKVPLSAGDGLDIEDTSFLYGQDVHEKGEEGEEEAQVEEETQAPSGRPTPILPSRAEIEEHELTHTPFWSWCVHCMRGNARMDPHKRATDEERALKNGNRYNIRHGLPVHH